PPKVAKVPHRAACGDWRTDERRRRLASITSIYARDNPATNALVGPDERDAVDRARNLAAASWQRHQRKRGARVFRSEDARGGSDEHDLRMERIDTDVVNNRRADAACAIDDRLRNRKGGTAVAGLREDAIDGDEKPIEVSQGRVHSLRILRVHIDRRDRRMRKRIC